MYFIHEKQYQSSTTTTLSYILFNKIEKPCDKRHCKKEIIYMKWASKLGWAGMDWIDLAQDRDRGLALVNAVMNRRVP
jgi:hypothetical protein